MPGDQAGIGETDDDDDDEDEDAGTWSSWDVVESFEFEEVAEARRDFEFEEVSEASVTSWVPLEEGDIATKLGGNILASSSSLCSIRTNKSELDLDAAQEMLEASPTSASFPFTMYGKDYSEISFLMGEWADSCSHRVSVVASDGVSATARISWDHSGRNDSNLWSAQLKVRKDGNGRWRCGNGVLAARTSMSRVVWMRDDGSCTEWIRTLPFSLPVLMMYCRPKSWAAARSTAKAAKSQQASSTDNAAVCQVPKFRSHKGKKKWRPVHARDIGA
eukprot:TRINITY_DN1645_c0_g1_i1.p1 TRINITY_DN1645_c0_g1~~TRINITY_DN1645_c0_g1_i1.p1  ORF type:complete len:275 (+),score=48.84 TRINITY_DN1645_c0_g1_i1:86-910(+)